jgi:hypothetical protein
MAPHIIPICALVTHSFAHAKTRAHQPTHTPQEEEQEEAHSDAVDAPSHSTVDDAGIRGHLAPQLPHFQRCLSLLLAC